MGGGMMGGGMMGGMGGMGGGAPPPVEPVRSDVPFIQCGACKALVRRAFFVGKQAREALKKLISTTLRGFGQLLVQGVDANAAARTQIVLLAHLAPAGDASAAPLAALHPGARSAQWYSRAPAACRDEHGTWIARWRAGHQNRLRIEIVPVFSILKPRHFLHTFQI